MDGIYCIDICIDAWEVCALEFRYRRDALLSWQEKLLEVSRDKIGFQPLNFNKNQLFQKMH